MLNNAPLSAAKQFIPSRNIVKVIRYGQGNVNDTYLVTSDLDNENPFILQRINRRVFKKPELILKNMQQISKHVYIQKSDAPSSVDRWETPEILKTNTGDSYFIDIDKSFWRALSFIDKSYALEKIKQPSQAAEVGYALGKFQQLISNMGIETLYDTLPGFHITPKYLKHYNGIKKVTSTGCQSADIKYCHQMIKKYKDCVNVLEDAKNKGILPQRPIHGDPKINNIMIDQVTGKAVGMIDLDSVKPGLVHYDIGDCLRSCCNLVGEEAENLVDVDFDLDICWEVLKGYFIHAKEFFLDHEYDYIFDSIKLITFELGLRFFIDFLEGNVYFKTKYESHNLKRALVQFELISRIESNKSAVIKMISDLR